VWCSSLSSASSLEPTRTVKRHAGPEHDQCASFRVNLGRELKNELNLHWMEFTGEIDICLCNSTVSTFVDHSKNKQIEIAKSMVGKRRVEEALETLIAKHHPQKCGDLPEHATRECSGEGHRSNICDFNCKSPYRKSINDHRCILPASPSARPKKRSLEEQVIIASSNCRPNEQVCARNIHGGNNLGHMSKFECIDISRDLENCGGCAAGSLGLEQEVLGVDCSDLDGVSDVRCVAGRCQVGRCGWGWQVNQRGDGCFRRRL